jgi:uncharacterized membrane protein
MAGLLYLPRLFVYHCEAEPGSKQSETFKVMERRLLTVIINPAMVASWVLDQRLLRSKPAASLVWRDQETAPLQKCLGSLGRSKE